jgi:hypothetical protein
MWKSCVQAAEVSQRRTVVSSKCFSYTIHAQTDSWPSRSPLLFPYFFFLLLWRFPSSQLFCVHYTDVWPCVSMFCDVLCDGSLTTDCASPTCRLVFHLYHMYGRCKNIHTKQRQRNDWKKRTQCAYMDLYLNIILGFSILQTKPGRSIFAINRLSSPTSV